RAKAFVESGVRQTEDLLYGGDAEQRQGLPEGRITAHVWQRDLTQGCLLSARIGKDHDALPRLGKGGHADAGKANDDRGLISQGTDRRVHGVRPGMQRTVAAAHAGRVEPEEPRLTP